MIFLRIFFALIFGASGIYHLIKPDFYLPLMPSFLPAHKPLIYLSGLVEIAVAVGLFIGPYRQLAVWGVIGLLIVFTPIHILDYLNEKPAVGSKNIAIGRLMMQVVMLIGAAYLL